MKRPRQAGYHSHTSRLARDMRSTLSLAFLMAIAVTAPTFAADSNTSGSSVRPPGEETSGKTQALEIGAALLQSKPPIQALNAYLNGFHFYNGNMKAQMEAHHYCSILNEEITQCVIYDGNVKDAKIMGVEYIISENLFKGLPAQEKALWHSHVHEVKSGQLVAPGIPKLAENELMKKMITTYGKTWHTWHTDLQKELPLGIPQLMMSFTGDGQVDPKMTAERDERLKIDSKEERKNRADIAAPPIAEGADAWQQGRAIQLTDPTGLEHFHPKGTRTEAPSVKPSPAVK